MSSTGFACIKKHEINKFSISVNGNKRNHLLVDVEIDGILFKFHMVDNPYELQVHHTKLDIKSDFIKASEHKRFPGHPFWQIDFGEDDKFFFLVFQGINKISKDYDFSVNYRKLRQDEL